MLAPHMLSMLLVIFIGASEASPFLVFNVAILSVCMYHDVMDRHDNLLLGLMILTNFYVNCCAWAQLASYSYTELRRHRDYNY